MKWPVVILASLQLLTVEAQDGNNVLATVSKTRSSRPCGLNKICVPNFNCRNDNGQGQTVKKLIDIRFNAYKVCNYLEKCCHLNNTSDQPNGEPINESTGRIQNGNPTLPTGNQIERNCGYRNQGGVLFGLIFAKANESEYAEFPWMVAILRNEHDNLAYECGGSIITPFIVLTAAHCVYNKVANRLTVRAGEWDSQTVSEPLPHQDRTVNKIIQNELFDHQTLIYDVALLVIEVPFILDQNVRPICLPSVKQLFDDTLCFATGWGKNKFGKEGKYQVILKKIGLPIMLKEDCQNKLRKTRLGHNFELNESFICAGGERDVDTCQGDGGSPLVCHIPGPDSRYFQAGIVAWGIGCGAQNVPGVYANVLHVLPWLSDALSKLNADPQYFNA